VGRVARAPTYLTLGVALYADMRLSAWLLGLNVRWDGFETLASAAPPGFEMESVGVGFYLVNELVRARALALQLGASAQLLATTQALEKLESETDRSAAVVRVGLLLRMLLGSSPLRWTVTLEPELSPMRLGKSLSLYSPLPTWSVGLGLGATWELR
jgi:hypothetical protein